MAQSDNESHMLAGISLGGMTSTLIAFHPTMGDSRNGASLSIAGTRRWMNNPEALGCFMVMSNIEDDVEGC